MTTRVSGSRWGGGRGAPKASRALGLGALVAAFGAREKAAGTSQRRFRGLAKVTRLGLQWTFRKNSELWPKGSAGSVRAAGEAGLWRTYGDPVVLSGRSSCGWDGQPQRAVEAAPGTGRKRRSHRASACGFELVGAEQARLSCHASASEASSGCGKHQQPMLCPSPRTTEELTTGGPTLTLCIYKIRENVFQEHHTLKEKELQTGPKASHGYGGKFCVEQYSMDKEQAKAKKKTSTESPTPHPAEERQPSSPIYEDAASLNAEKRIPMTSMRTTWASQPSHSRTTRLDRTPDLVLAKQVLTPLRYIPALSVCYFCGIGHYHLPIHTTPVAVDDCEALCIRIAFPVGFSQLTSFLHRQGISPLAWDSSHGTAPGF
ncbi:uncharacterized protein LOC106025875 [Cavia porcellus]|uniref:uncharacterized protein LOC106025875 n=1 Tax=Cavia porcellus TaxID=10141 RepID=UPI002FE1E952